MSTPPRKKPAAPPTDERRASTDESGAGLRRLTSVLGRPLKFERRDGKLGLVLVERRRTTRSDRPPSLRALGAELRSQLAVHKGGPGARFWRHLAFVQGELERSGWAGVAGLPGRLLLQALEQAEMLGGADPSPEMGEIVRQLRLLSTEAARREESEASWQGGDPDGQLEVSETTHDEFEEAARSWVGALDEATRTKAGDA